MSTQRSVIQPVSRSVIQGVFGAAPAPPSPSGLGQYFEWRDIVIWNGGSTVLEISELVAVAAGSPIAPIPTVSSNIADGGGSDGLQSLADNDAFTRPFWVSPGPTLTIRLDYGEVVAPDGWQQAGFDNPERYISDATVWVSDDAIAWTQISDNQSLLFPGFNTYSATYPFTLL